MKKSGLLLLASCTSSSAFQQVFDNRIQNVVLPTSSNSRIPRAVLYMQPFESDEVKSRSLRLGKVDTPYKGSSSDKRLPRTELLASTLESAENIDTSLLGRFEIPSLGPKTLEAVTKVLSASLLITGNTVGSSMFVLPDAVSGVGLLNGSAIFIGKMIIA